MWQVFVVWWQVLTHSSSVPSIAPLDGLPSRQAPRAQRCSSLPPVYPALICHARNDGAVESVSANFACRHCGTPCTRKACEQCLHSSVGPGT